jgi:hypothetical protein
MMEPKRQAYKDVFITSSVISRQREQIIVTSFLFPSCHFSLERLKNLSLLVGKDRLVVDVRSVGLLCKIDKLY